MSRRTSRVKRLSEPVMRLLSTYETRLVIEIYIGFIEHSLHKGIYGFFIGESLMGRAIFISSIGYEKLMKIEENSDTL